MAGAHNVKETVEAIKGGIALGRLVQDVLKDGAQLTDLMVVFNKYQSDAAFKAKMDTAFADMAKIPNEINDLDLHDCVELIKGVAEALA